MKLSFGVVFSYTLTVLSLIYIIITVATSWPSYASRMEAFHSTPAMVYVLPEPTPPRLADE